MELLIYWQIFDSNLHWNSNSVTVIIIIASFTNWLHISLVPRGTEKKMFFPLIMIWLHLLKLRRCTVARECVSRVKSNPSPSHSTFAHLGNHSINDLKENKRQNERHLRSTFSFSRQYKHSFTLVPQCRGLPFRTNNFSFFFYFPLARKLRIPINTLDNPEKINCCERVTFTKGLQTQTHEGMSNFLLNSLSSRCYIKRLFPIFFGDRNRHCCEGKSHTWEY